MRLFVRLTHIIFVLILRSKLCYVFLEFNLPRKLATYSVCFETTLKTFSENWWFTFVSCSRYVRLVVISSIFFLIQFDNRNCDAKCHSFIESCGVQKTALLQVRNLLHNTFIYFPNYPFIFLILLFNSVIYVYNNLCIIYIYMYIIIWILLSLSNSLRNDSICFIDLFRP